MLYEVITRPQQASFRHHRDRGMSRHRANHCRITSYNVCYTKLLRVTPGQMRTRTPAARQAFSSSSARPNIAGSPPLRRTTRLATPGPSAGRGRRADRPGRGSGTPRLWRCACANRECRVITSYSIHYTKLYETTSVAPLFCSGPPRGRSPGRAS